MKRFTLGTRTRVTLLGILALMFAAGCGSSTESIRNFSYVKVVNLGPQINSPYDDYSPFVSYDGKLLLFTSKRPAPGGIDQQDDLWMAKRSRTGWSMAEYMSGSINTENDEGAPFIDVSGQVVYFVECDAEDAVGGCDIYKARFVNGRLEQVQNLGKPINSEYWDSQPFVSNDGQYFLFASDRPGGFGGTDLYVSKKLRNGRWGKPRNLGPVINSNGDEKSPFLSPDGTTLYFASDGHGGVGGMDLMIALRNTRSRVWKWNEPVNIGTPINSAADELFFSVSAEEDTIYLASSREGSLGGLDIFAAFPNPYKDTTRYQWFIVGRVGDSVTATPLPGAMVRIYNRDSGEDVELATDRTGSYRFRIRPGSRLKLTAQANGYATRTLEVNIPRDLRFREYRKNILLPPGGKVKSAAASDEVALDSTALFVVHFDFDKANIRSDAARVLDKVIAILKEEPETEVYLDAHTDDMGTELYNLRLSRKRGAAVVRYFAAHGINRSRCKVTAHGEVLPAIPNQTEEAREKNRRVEIRFRIHSSASERDMP
ncbi:MAG: OmpA family protein [Chlorobi bacterium]|nr:OmpA family protein [Chlorobiota bacterium]